MVPPAASSPPDGLTLTFFDVGQGESALVESPAGVRMLIDGGPDERFVAARLDKRGLERLDVVVLSHDHADHANGLRAVMDKMEVRLAIGPGVGQVMRGVEAVGEGDLYLIGDVEVSVLGPARDLFEAAMTEDAQEAGGSPINDASVVLRIAWRQTCVLFTGDIEENGQRTLIERHAGEINCPVLKAPHHGSPRILEEFVQAVSPRHAVVSVGLNEYGHPSRRALSMFERAGARVMRTDRMDDIVLEVRRDGSIDVK